MDVSTVSIKEEILNGINAIMRLDDYNRDDCIYSQKYGIPPAGIVYVLLHLSKAYGFQINDGFVDELEMCTFGKLEELAAAGRGDAA